MTWPIFSLGNTTKLAPPGFHHILSGILLHSSQEFCSLFHPVPCVPLLPIQTHALCLKEICTYTVGSVHLLSLWGMRWWGPCTLFISAWLMTGTTHVHDCTSGTTTFAETMNDHCYTWKCNSKGWWMIEEIMKTEYQKHYTGGNRLSLWKPRKISLDIPKVYLHD